MASLRSNVSSALVVGKRSSGLLGMLSKSKKLLVPLKLLGKGVLVVAGICLFTALLLMVIV